MGVAAVPAIGDVVMDRYRVERFVGSGGMAHVLAARHLTLGNEVAIKVLEPQLANDLEARERFARESRAMATLTSKHTVRVFDVGALPSGLPFMVMELLEGRDLNRELAERGPLPFLEACEYIDQACEAVAEAHAQGIIHRDLKPHNLFLTQLKGKPLIRVLDFGIARTIKGGAVPKLETITRLGDVVGTLHYMAPEQIRNSAAVEPRSDVWALGACLYKLITGFPPFPQQGEAPLMSAILTAPPKPIGEHRKDVPAVLASVIMRCLRKPVEERFPNANELRKALAEAIALMATSDLADRTDVMAHPPDVLRRTAGLHKETMRSGTLDPEPPRKKFDKTMPLDARMARELVERRSSSSPMLAASASSSSMLAAPSAAPAPRASSPMIATGRPSYPMAPPAPMPPASHMPATPPAPRSSSLTFLAIVAAVAIGVFLAGLGLIVVSRYR
ncbi:MAG: serine/threonine protein kinase [Labilithrix sp.]|nr:serine/threonine protein kinase [Labilithrix sp.]MCW5811930.1 serine/threonine protein kinase [Labilithrix sp.]